MSECYRCGWCGQPTDKDGRVLDMTVLKEMEADWGKAEQTHGDCCIEEQETNRVQITREMAMDAGCPEIEGTGIDW